jgi:CubicO group peptidase (beta-lactamase class C family)
MPELEGPMQQMLRPTALLLALIALASPAAPPQDVSATLTPILERHKIPGMVAAVVDTKSTVMLGAAGVRKAGGADKVTPADLFHLGSCTKAMTATLCAVLVEEGKLKWNSTPADVWPQMKDKFHVDFRGVTLAHLLHHRAGIPSDTSPDDVWHAMRQFKGAPQAARLKLVEMALAKPPATPPGSKYVYTNSGYTIAGAMCEKVTGTPYETLIKQRLFDPLGMKSAGFGAPAQPNQPRGHGKSGTPVEPGPAADNPAAYSPSGRAHMSIEDWGKFITFHLQGAKGDTKLLKKSSYEVRHRPATGEGLPYAGGWIVARRPWAGGVALSHAGTNTSWYCVTWLAPEKGFAVLVACNSGKDGADKATDEVASTLIKSFLESNRN